jgi:hypothetical protein
MKGECVLAVRTLKGSSIEFIYLAMKLCLIVTVEATSIDSSPMKDVLLDSPY